ncbi:hypothetical protein RHSIM_Rhsim03G0008000 [Rhododendron simsii]|uniref:Ankyrin repeat family protein n=1 Tax=Rhododendron simsii TaxID=118357 RepID=A0A834H5N7_RHOSS|nr:hypothetical protein RHSIM_Rhsim03G0008000 [Rhododendron simsii]
MCLSLCLVISPHESKLLVVRLGAEEEAKRSIAAAKEEEEEEHQVGPVVEGVEEEGRVVWTTDYEYSDCERVDRVDETIGVAIALDDKETLFSVINNPDLFSVSSYNSEHKIWEEICTYDAVNCAAAFLEGEWELGLPMGVISPVAGSGEAFPLHYAAKRLPPRVVELLLSHGARTDIKLYDPLNRRGHDGLLPLEIALDVARECLPRRIVFSSEPSIFQLIASLGLPGMKGRLKTIKLLALSTENVGKIAYDYAMEGKLAEFAVLLTVAREKVLVPITFSRHDGDGWDGSMTLHQGLEDEMGSLFHEECRLTGSFANKELTWIKRKKILLRSIALLLEVYERAGNAIEECIQLERHSKEVEKDVALRLVEAGFRLKKGDSDFSIDDRMNSGDSMRSPIQCLLTGVPSLSPHLPLLPEWNFKTRRAINPGTGYGFTPPTYPSKRTHSYVSKSIFGSHYSTSLDVQVKNQTKTMEQGLHKYLSWEKLAYISMLIKKGIRSA